MYQVVVLLGALLLGPPPAWAQCPLDCNCTDTVLGPAAKCTNLVEVFPDEDHMELKVLDISFNRIAILKDKAFHNALLLELIHLNISHNAIKMIHESAFDLMEDLKVLDLSHNNLSALQASAFSSDLLNLEELYLNDNPLLVLFQGFSFVRIKKLDLNNCHLATLPDKFFEEMTTISHLNLESNDMESFENMADVSKLMELSLLNLKRNKMCALHHGLLRMDVKVLIELADNPWICNCNFLNNMFFTYKEREYSPDLICASPKEIRGRIVSTELADERCNTDLVTESSSFSVPFIWVPAIIGGTTLLLLVVICCLERKFKCFDCLGDGKRIE